MMSVGEWVWEPLTHRCRLFGGVVGVLLGYASLNDEVNRAVVSAAPVYVRTLPALS
jgi:hypothetical protein